MIGAVQLNDNLLTFCSSFGFKPVLCADAFVDIDFTHTLDSHTGKLSRLVYRA